MTGWIPVERFRLVGGLLVGIAVTADHVRLSLGRWERVLSREEALDLAEAIERAASQWPPR